MHICFLLCVGRTPQAGEKTHIKRRRLTRSWWNDIWRDRLLAAVRYLADGDDHITFAAGNEHFQMSAWPIEAEIPVFYHADDAPLPNEEDDEGNIIPSAALDDYLEQGDLDDDGTEAA